MSTWEKSTIDLAACPCGVGRILQDVESPDNPWSKASFYTRIECSNCSVKYIIEYEKLICIEDKRRLIDAYSALAESRGKRRAVLAKILDAAVASCATHKDEYNLLKREGLTALGPIQYPRRRANGSAASELCALELGEGWIRKAAGLQDRLAELEDADKEFESHETESSKIHAEMHKNSIAIKGLKK